jgi:Holliday junction resolvase RusA-like endonuclease
MDATTAIMFEIPGDPIPQPRARFANGRAYTPDRRGLKNYKAAIALSCMAAARRAGWDVTAGPHEIGVEAIFTRPPSHLTADGRSLRKTAAPFPGQGCGDLDNLEKAIWDSITTGGGVWRDDSQIVASSASKRYAPPGATGRLRVTIRRPPP